MDDKHLLKMYEVYEVKCFVIWALISYECFGKNGRIGILFNIVEFQCNVERLYIHTLVY